MLFKFFILLYENLNEQKFSLSLIDFYEQNWKMK